MEKPLQTLTTDTDSSGKIIIIIINVIENINDLIVCVYHLCWIQFHLEILNESFSIDLTIEHLGNERERERVRRKTVSFIYFDFPLPLFFSLFSTTIHSEITQRHVPNQHELLIYHIVMLRL